MRRRALLAAVLAALLIVPAVASADVTDSSDPIVTVTLVGAKSDDSDNVFVGSLHPSFLIQVKDQSATVQCAMDTLSGGQDGPCGTPVTTGCQAFACFSYTPSVDKGGFHIMTVDYTISEFTTGKDFQFNADATPPDTALSLPPNPLESLLPSPAANLRPQFDVNVKDDFLEDDDFFQCTISLARSAPPPFRTCNTSKPPARLRATSTYLYRVRTVDLLGRADPTPAQYVFSPTPCRPKLIGHVHGLSQIAHHGLRLKISCVQPGRFAVQLQLQLRVVVNLHLPSQDLGDVHGRMTRQGQTKTVTLHLLRGIPSFLFAGKPPMDVVVGETAGYGSPGSVTNILHR